MSWKRSYERKKRMKKLAKVSSYPSGAYYVDEIWVKNVGYVKNPKPYYKRYYRGNLSTYLKKQSNKKIRRYKGTLPNGKGCYRIYDFWWELY